MSFLFLPNASCVGENDLFSASPMLLMLKWNGELKTILY